MSRLDPHDVVETELLAALSEPRPGGHRGAQQALSEPAEREPQRSLKSSPLLVIALNGLLMVAVVGLFMLRQRASRAMVWEETFDPLRAEQWQAADASAAWEDLPGPGAALPGANSLKRHRFICYTLPPFAGGICLSGSHGPSPMRC